MTLELPTNGKSSAGFGISPIGRIQGIVDKSLFMKLLCLERKRAERSGKQFALMLVEPRKTFQTEQGQIALQKIISSLSASTRETDIVGWHEEDSVLGIIYSEIGDTDPQSILKILLDKAIASLRSELGSTLFAQIHISLQRLPEKLESDLPKTQVDFELYPELTAVNGSRRSSPTFKRFLDIASSLFMLM